VSKRTESRLLITGLAVLFTMAPLALVADIAFDMRPLSNWLLAIGFGCAFVCLAAVLWSAVADAWRSNAP
jgi:hypothetical protein